MFSIAAAICTVSIVSIAQATGSSAIDILEQVCKSALYSNGYVAPESGLLRQGKLEEEAVQFTKTIALDKISEVR